LTSLHATQNLVATIRDLKTSTTAWIKKNEVFDRFTGWQNEYGAFTKSHSEHNVVIDYIKGQKEHHQTISFIDEFKRLLTKEGISFDSKYLH